MAYIPDTSPIQTPLQERLERPTTPIRSRSYYRSTGLRDLRGSTSRTCRGRSWRPPAARPCPRLCWLSASSWLAGLAKALTGSRGAKLRSQKHIAVETLLDVAAVDARTANGRTGRGVCTAHGHVAKVLGCSEKTVQRARWVIEKLGFAVVVEVGRRLNAEERILARQHHGGRQVNIASERALVQPRPRPTSSPAVRQLVPLSRRDQVSKKFSVCDSCQTRASARRSKKTRSKLRPSLDVQRLAADLVVLDPRLGRGHIGRLCRGLEALGIDACGWTAKDVFDAITCYNQDRGLFEPRIPKNPIGLLIHQMRQILPTVDEPPRQRRAREIAQEQARRQARAVEREAELQRMREENTPERRERRKKLIAALRTKIQDHIRASSEQTALDNRRAEQRVRQEFEDARRTQRETDAAFRDRVQPALEWEAANLRCHRGESVSCAGGSKTTSGRKI